MWIIFALSAVVSQLIRNLGSKKLIGRVSPSGVALSRFLYSLPVVALFYTIFRIAGGPVTLENRLFYLWTFLMGLSQVLATYFRVSLFKYKNFAVSVTLVQIDTVFVAVIGALILGETLPPLSWVGVASGTIGLIIASLTKNSVQLSHIKEALFSKATLLAITTGLFLALAAFFSKKATAVVSGPFNTRTLYTLLHIIVFEIIILLPTTYINHKESLVSIIKRPGIPITVGIFSGIGSFCWISAYSLTKLANVRVLGQSEFILATLITLFYFREKIKPPELLGIILVSLGAILIIF